MDKIIKKKFIALSQDLSLENNLKVVQQYNKAINFSRYAIPYSFGLLFSATYVMVETSPMGIMGSSALTLALSVPFSILGIIPSMPILKFLKQTKFKAFRKFKMFESIQDSYFYIQDKITHILKDKEAQYIFYHFFESTKDFIISPELKNNFMHSLALFKHALENQCFNIAAEHFLFLYPHSIHYIEFIGLQKESSYDNDMLSVQAKLIGEYLSEQMEEKEWEFGTTPDKSTNWRELMDVKKK